MKVEMRKIKIITILVALYIGIMFSNSQVFAFTGTTKNDTTRLREKASTDSATVILISVNEEVEIVSEDGDWYKVTYKSNGYTYTGYVRKDMLTVDGSSKETEETSDEEETDAKEGSQNETTVEEEAQSEETTSEEKAQNEESVTIQEGVTLTISKDISIKILPLIQSNIIGTVKNQAEITVTEIVGNWCYIETTENAGWAVLSSIEAISQNESSEEVVEEENNEDSGEEAEDEVEDTSSEENTESEAEIKTLYISSETVNLREEASSSASILKQLSRNTAVTVVEEVDESWTKVTVSGLTGYVASEYLSETKTEVTSRGSDTARTEKEETEDTTTTSTSTSETTSSNSSAGTVSATSVVSESGVTGSDIVYYAKKYLGYKYVSGGASPSTGFDCSGLTYYVYAQNGYIISRTSSAQASNGTKVEKSDLQLGDLVIFNNSSNTAIGHVGIYIGGNEFIHAANASKGVITTSLSNSYYAARYVCARRIIN